MINKIPQAIFGCRSASTKRSCTTLFLSDSYTKQNPYSGGIDIGISHLMTILTIGYLLKLFSILLGDPKFPFNCSPGCQVVLHKATAIDAKAITSTPRELKTAFPQMQGTSHPKGAGTCIFPLESLKKNPTRSALLHIQILLQYPHHIGTNVLVAALRRSAVMLTVPIEAAMAPSPATRMINVCF